MKSPERPKKAKMKLPEKGLGEKSGKKPRKESGEEFRKEHKQATGNPPGSEELLSAVALAYDITDKEAAPTILAKADGELADQILNLARDSEIPIHKNPDLLALLKASDLGEEIPLEAFIAVAEILRFIYEQNGTKIPST